MYLADIYTVTRGVVRGDPGRVVQLDRAEVDASEVQRHEHQRHQDRQVGMFHDVPGGAAEDHLAQPALRVGALDQ